MIFLTRIDKQQMFLNPDHIVSIEETPDTVITLFNGNHFIVKETASIIISRIVAYRSKIIRRSGWPVRRKHLKHHNISLFRSSTLNRDIVCPEKCSIHERSPIHSREF